MTPDEGNPPTFSELDPKFLLESQVPGSHTHIGMNEDHLVDHFLIQNCGQNL